MLFSKAAALLLALAPSALLAAPTPSKTINSIAELIAKRNLAPGIVSKLTDGICDLSKAVMPIAPTPLPSPTGLTLSHVAIGRGTQNYTCTPPPGATTSPVPKALGALATLFNVTCDAVRAPAILSNITTMALRYDVPSGDVADLLESGHHEFNDKGAPFFKLVTDRVNYGTVQSKMCANSTAPAGASEGPNGMGSVPWLALNGTSGDFKMVYRLNTAGGVAPKTCEGIAGDFTVSYAAEYWFWK